MDAAEAGAAENQGTVAEVEDVAAGAQLARDLVQAINRKEEAESALRGAVSTGDERMMTDRARGYVTARRDVGRIGSEVAGVAGNPTAVPGADEPQPPQPGGRPGEEPVEADEELSAQGDDRRTEGEPKPKFARGTEVTLAPEAGGPMVGKVTSYLPTDDGFVYVVRDDGKQMLTEEPVPEEYLEETVEAEVVEHDGPGTGADTPPPAAA